MTSLVLPEITFSLLQRPHSCSLTRYILSVNSQDSSVNFQDASVNSSVKLSSFCHAPQSVNSKDIFGYCCKL